MCFIHVKHAAFYIGYVCEMLHKIYTRFHFTGHPTPYSHTHTHTLTNKGLMTMTDSFKLSLNPHLSAPPSCDTADPHPSTLYTKAWPWLWWQPIDLWPNPSLPSTSSTVLAHCLQPRGGEQLLTHPHTYPTMCTYIYMHMCTTTCHWSLCLSARIKTPTGWFIQSVFSGFFCFVCVCFLINILQRNNDWCTNWIHSTSNATLGTFMWTALTQLISESAWVGF